MYAASALLKQYLARSDREFEIKAIVGGVTYDDTKVVEFAPEESIIASDDFAIGAVIASKLSITIKTTDTVPFNAKIQPFFRMNGSSGYTGWVPLGSFYIDSRTFANDVWKFVCYDKLIITQQPFVSTLTYPISMQSVWNELCGQLGFTSDSSVVINSGYEIPYKDEEITMREMLSYIASAHGASIRMTKDEKIAFVKFAANPPRSSIGPSDYYKCNQTNPVKTYTSILLTYNPDGETLTAGTGDTDHTLKLYNPFMTEAMLTSVMASVNGFSYAPMSMEWKGRPDYEPGDAVAITLRDGTVINSTLLSNSFSHKGGLKEKSSAPSLSAQQSEFNYAGSLSKVTAGVVKLGKVYYGVSIGRTYGIKITRSDGVSEAIFNSDLIQITKNGLPVFSVNSDGDLMLTGAIVEDILHIGPVTALGQCHINSNEGGLRLQAHQAGNYINFNDDGGVTFYEADNDYAQIWPTGLTNLKPIPADKIIIGFSTGGFTTDLDGVKDSWSWQKDGSGRITSLTAASGRTITVTY